MNDRESVEKTLKWRNKGHKIDLNWDNLKISLEYFNWNKSELEKLENKLEKDKKTVERLVVVKNLSETEEAELESAKVVLREAKRKRKEILKEIGLLDVKVVPMCLKIPNILHPNTPENEDRILELDAYKPDFPVLSHVQLGENSSELTLTDNCHTGYYLKGRLAKLELHLSRKCKNHFLNSGFGLVSGPDFVTSLMIEGCGQDFTDPKSVFALEPTHSFDSRETTVDGLHLVGSASIYSQMAYFCKFCLLNKSSLPISKFTIGWRYRPRPSESVSQGLFETQQTKQVEILHAFGHDSELDEFNHVLEHVVDLYKQIHLPFRIVVRSAPKLKQIEKYRVALEILSPHSGRYIETGHLSLIGDYVSSRLMLKARPENSGKQFMNLNFICGTALDFTKFVGLAMEHGQKRDQSDYVIDLPQSLLSA